MEIDVYKIAILAGTGIGLTVVAMDKKMPGDKKVKYMGVIGGVGTGAFIGRNVYNNWKRKQEVREHEQSQIAGGVNLSQTAMDIHDAFYNADIFGFTENEEQAIAALKRVPKEYISQLALLYNKKYDENLYEDFRRFLDNVQYAQVSNLLN